jgi:hypothetical protein
MGISSFASASDLHPSAKGERRMRATRILLLVMAWVFIATLGCKKNAVDTTAFKSALNSYYAGKQGCLFTVPVKFPVQADTSKDEETRSYDALTDAGLLKRTPEEKKRFLVGSKQVNDYDLSDQGRQSWTVDPSQPGYGNFCYGRPEVSDIDSFVAADDTGTRYTVTYHYSASNPPGWTNSPGMKNAFPRLAAETSGRQVATATLLKTESGWQVQNVQAAPSPASTM